MSFPAYDTFSLGGATVISLTGWSTSWTQVVGGHDVHGTGVTPPPAAGSCAANYNYPVAGTTLHIAYWNADTYTGTKHNTRVSLTPKFDGTGARADMGPATRIQDSTHYYTSCVKYNTGTASYDLTLYRNDGGGITAIGSGSTAFTPGDILIIETANDTIRLKVLSGGESTIYEVTDTPGPDTGYAGIYANISAYSYESVDGFVADVLSVLNETVACGVVSATSSALDVSLPVTITADLTSATASIQEPNVFTGTFVPADVTSVTASVQEPSVFVSTPLSKNQSFINPLVPTAQFTNLTLTGEIEQVLVYTAEIS